MSYPITTMGGLGDLDPIAASMHHYYGTMGDAVPVAPAPAPAQGITRAGWLAIGAIAGLGIGYALWGRK